MDKLNQILLLLIEFSFSIYIMIVLLRFIMQLVRADFYNPISQFIVKATNPLLLPLRKVIPGLFGVDIASLLLALALQMAALQLIGLVVGAGLYPIGPLVLGSLWKLLDVVLNVYFFSFIILIIVSWIAPHTYNPVMSVIQSITEPVLRPIRRVIPSMGGLDFSVMFAMLGIYIIRILIS